MPQLPLTTESFREVASRYATGVVVVTTQADGFDHAMTATSFTTVSLDPMLVLICVENDTRFHDALCSPDQLPEQAWGISVLPATGKASASWLATKGRPLHGQFDRIGHTRGDETGVILLTDALATMEVRTVENYPAGDHTIVVGRVLSLASSDDVVDETSDRDNDWPLMYWARRYRSLDH